MDGEYCFDFEIEENLSIDENFLETFNEFESCEVEAFDDFSARELNEICIMDEEQRLEPMLKFCDEAEILQVAVHDASNFKSSVFVCELCGRSYKRKCFFDKHIVLYHSYCDCVGVGCMFRMLVLFTFITFIIIIARC